MKFIKTALVAAMATSLTACVIVIDGKGSSATLETSKTLSLNTNAVKDFAIQAAGGELQIVGRDDVNQITVDAVIYTTEEDPEAYELTLKQSGDSAKLFAEADSGKFYFGNSPRIDLVVTMPSHLALEIQDGSGGIEVQNVKNGISISDGSGDILVSGIDGGLTISDGSGDIHIKKVSGDIKVSDGSGELTIVDVKGNLEVSDGSGDMAIEQVQGSLDITDGSGEMEIRTVRGLVTVSDGSGDIIVNDADGLTVKNAGSGDLKISQVNNVTTL